jgi:hypothetical protein
MQKFTVDVDLGVSGFNFDIEAEDYVSAMVATMQRLNKNGLEDHQIDSLKITVQM